MWVLIPPGAWMSVCCECFGFCLVDVSARNWLLAKGFPNGCGVSEYDREVSIMRRTWPKRGFWIMGNTLRLFDIWTLFRHFSHKFVTSVRPRVSALLPLDGFSWNLVLRDFYEFFQLIPPFVKLRATISASLYGDLRKTILLTTMWNVLCLDNSTKGSHCCVSITIFSVSILLKATCTSTIQSAHIVVLPWRQWLIRRAKTLGHAAWPANWVFVKLKTTQLINKFPAIHGSIPPSN